MQEPYEDKWEAHLTSPVPEDQIILVGKAGHTVYLTKNSSCLRVAGSACGSKFPPHWHSGFVVVLLSPRSKKKAIAHSRMQMRC